MEERDIARVLKRGFPVPDKALREDLLQRCLDVLGEDEGEAEDEGVVLADEQLEMLAAAGVLRPPMNGDSNDTF